MGREKGRVLVVDDSETVCKMVVHRLIEDGFEARAVLSGLDAIAAAQTDPQPDVILLDVEMPELDGFEVCRTLKSSLHTMRIPILFLTAQTDTAHKVKGLDLGAVDYITKPFEPVELQARVRSAYRTKRLMDMLEEKAQVDGLTGLFNRAHLNNRLNEELARAKRYQFDLSLVIMDVDRFKSLNDNHGHLFGDSVLAEVADVARRVIRTEDVIARYGGEEFVLLLPEQDHQGGGEIAERLRRVIESLPFHRTGVPVKVTASFGVSSTRHVGYESISPLIDSADQALYAAKRAGRNRVCIWNEQLSGSSIQFA